MDLHIKLNLCVSIAKCQMPMEFMHEWVDQFATQAKSLFIQNFGQFWKLQLLSTSLH